MYTRREFGKLAIAGFALPRLVDAAIDSKVNGVRLGVQTYSFRDLPRTPGGDAQLEGIAARPFRDARTADQRR